MSEFIPLSVPNLSGNEKKYVLDAIEQEWVSTGGAYIEQLEDVVASYVGAKDAAACQSGTAGLHLSLLVTGVTEQDEVIVPTLTFIAAVNPVRYLHAHPVFMDCDESLCLDTKKLQNFLEFECYMSNGELRNKVSHRRIKAVVVVHVFGNLADMEHLMELSRIYGFSVIEDATEALGSYYTEGVYSGRYAGTIGDIGVYSFNGNKIITTGGGGMLVSQKESLIQKAKFLSTQAKSDPLYFIHDEIGYNYRMTNVQAAIGLGQMEQLETFIEIKKRNYQLYQDLGIRLLSFRKGTRPNYWFYSFLTDQRDHLIHYLNCCKVQSRPVWKLVHTQVPYQEFQSYQITSAILYWNQIVNLPCSTNLHAEQVKQIAEFVQKFMEQGVEDQ